MRKLAVALFGGASAVTTHAYAWGDEGHKVVCEIAFNQVKPTTRAAIVQLIKADDERRTTLERWVAEIRRGLKKVARIELH